MPIPQDLEVLIHGEHGPAVTITLPTHRAGQQIMQDPIRLENLLNRAEERLVARGWRLDDLRGAVTGAARALLPDKEFWRYQEDGLALFLAPDVFHTLKTAVPLPEGVHLGRRFHIVPLLEVLAPRDAFVLLALSQDRVRLFRGHRDGLEPMSAEGIPQSVREVYEESDYTQDIQANPLSRKRRARTMRFQPDSSNVAQAHNVGDSAEQTRYAQLVEFIRRVAAVIDERLADRREPVVLAALPDLQGEFRKLSRLEPLLPEGVAANPDGLDDRDLHRRAMAVVAPRFAALREQAVTKTVAALSDAEDRRATDHADEIVRGAHWGRVDTLLVSEGARLSGRFDPAADKVEWRPDDDGEAEDLVNLAALATLRHGGQVHAVPPGTVPGGPAAGRADALDGLTVLQVVSYLYQSRYPF